MRTILSLGLTALATLLLCHGTLLDEDARGAHAGHDPAKVSAAAWAYPYAPATLEAAAAARSAALLRGREARGPLKWDHVPSLVLASASEAPPFLRPVGAAALALAVLLLTLILPRTRHRSLVALSILFGGAGVVPLFLPERDVLAVLADVPVFAPAVDYAPWTAIALLYLAAIGLAFSVRRGDRVVERVVIAGS